MTSSFVEWWTPGVDTVTDSPIDAMVTQLIYGFSICHEIYQICTNYNRHSNLKYIFWNHTHWDKIKEKTLHFVYHQQKKTILYSDQSKKLLNIFKIVSVIKKKLKSIASSLSLLHQVVYYIHLHSYKFLIKILLSNDIETQFPIWHLCKLIRQSLRSITVWRIRSCTRPNERLLLCAILLAIVVRTISSAFILFFNTLFLFFIREPS